jgi:hypothetical protein
MASLCGQRYLCVSNLCGDHQRPNNRVACLDQVLDTLKLALEEI